MVEKILKSINPKNIDITELSTEEFLKMLIKLNKVLRALDDKEEVIEEDMSAGNLVSPTREVQDRILDYLVGNLSKVEDKKARAAMTYYTLLNLHMFSDGNGRTSRFMYDYVSGDLSEENIPFYFHKEYMKMDHQRNDLERSKGIEDVGEVDKIPDIVLKKHFDFVPEYIFDNYYWITVGHTLSSPPTEEILPKAALKDLSEKEKRDIDKILRDGYGVELCPSGLAVLYVAQKRGELGNWWQRNELDFKEGKGVEGRFNFSVYKHPEMISSWTADDFRELIRVGNDVKYDRLKSIIDLFVTPGKYVDPWTGHTYSDKLLGNIPEEKKATI